VTALRLLLFRCGEQVFAVEAGAVREILAASPPTRVPGAAEAVRGLVNVRGTLVTVVDAAAAVGLPAGSHGGGSVILVERGSRPVGLQVDEVLDLVTVDPGALDDHSVLPGVRPDLVRAVGTAGGRSFVHLATDVLLEPLLP
jgi:purine-binding chemotaxis protein CheW